MTIIERIEALMNEQGISKADLLHMSGLKRSTFYNVFDPKTNPEKIKLDTMRPIAAALHTTLDYLITGDNKQNGDAFCVNTIISIGRGGERTEYEISDEDAALVDAFLKKLKKN